MKFIWYEVYSIKIHYIVFYPVSYDFICLLIALLVVCQIFIQQRGWTLTPNLTLIGSKHLLLTRDVVREISKIR